MIRCNKSTAGKIKFVVADFHSHLLALSLLARCRGLLGCTLVLLLLCQVQMSPVRKALLE